jgi:hypothetical protein
MRRRRTRKKESEKQSILPSFIWQQRKSSKARLSDSFLFTSILVQEKKELEQNRKGFCDSIDKNAHHCGNQSKADEC